MTQRFTDLVPEGAPAHHYKASDADIKVFWKATGELGGPFGAAWRLLLLTGARKNEIGELRRQEIDLGQKTIVIPAERLKSGRDHVIPLSKAALAILEALPLWNGEFVFGTTGDSSR